MRRCILKLFAHLFSSLFSEFGYRWSKIFPSPHILINLIGKIYLRIIHIMTSHIREISFWNTAHLKCLSSGQNRFRQQKSIRLLMFYWKKRKHQSQILYPEGQCLISKSYGCQKGINKWLPPQYNEASASVPRVPWCVEKGTFHQQKQLAVCSEATKLKIFTMYCFILKWQTEKQLFFFFTLENKTHSPPLTKAFSWFCSSPFFPRACIHLLFQSQITCSVVPQ